MQKTANKVVYNDGKRLLFAYPILDVAALMDILYISRSSAVRPTLHSQVHHNVVFFNVIDNHRTIFFYLRQLLSMTQYILNYLPFLFLHKLL